MHPFLNELGSLVVHIPGRARALLLAAGLGLLALAQPVHAQDGVGGAIFLPLVRGTAPGATTAPQLGPAGVETLAVFSAATASTESTGLSQTASWYLTDITGVTSVAWGDIDGDGDLDLAVGTLANGVKLYRNQHGSIEPSSSWSSAEIEGVSSVAWGDVDGDGDLDLAAGSSQTRIYRNTGGDLERRPAWSATAAGSVLGIAWGDVNGDGYLDLAAVGANGATKVYLNVEGGLQTGHTWTSSNEFAASVAWVDIDGNGHLDLAIGTTESVKTYLNFNGTLQTSPAWMSELGVSASDMAWADMDADGDPDLATSGRSGGEFYRNEGGNLERVGGFWCGASTPLIGIGSIEWGDLDSDGDLDLAVGCYGRQDLMYLNVGGNLQEQPAWSSENVDNTGSIAWSDFDGDGDLDLTIGNLDGSSKIYRNAGAKPTQLAWSRAARSSTEGVAWGDVDGDGDLDLGAGNSYAQIYRNNGVALEQAAERSSVFADKLAWGDVDNDGDLDLAVTSDGGPTQVVRNVGGSLESQASWASATDATQSLAWGDVDGDGDLDLVLGNNGTPSKLYLNDGGTLRASPEWQSTPAPTQSLAWGDVDGDGDLDLALGNNGTPSQLYLNTSGRLEALPAWSSGSTERTMSVAWGDFDGDGDLDLALGNDGTPSRLYRNDGGHLQAAPAWSSSYADTTRHLAWGDTDGDGDLDLAVGNEGMPGRVYLNEDGSLQSAANWSSGDDRVQSIAWGDADGDGDLDLAAGRKSIRDLPGGGEQLYRNGSQGDIPGMHYPPAIAVSAGAAGAADYYAVAKIADSPTIPIRYSLFSPSANRVGRVEAFYSANGGGQWLPAVAAGGTVTKDLSAGRWYAYATAASVPLPVPDGPSSSLATTVLITESFDVADVTVWVAITHTSVSDLALTLQAPDGRQVRLVAAGQGGGFPFAGATFTDRASEPLSTTGSGPYLPLDSFQAFSHTLSAGTWTLLVTQRGGTGTLTAWGLRLKSPPVEHVYYWDTAASGFFGKSDNVTIRLVATAQPISTTIAGTGTYRYTGIAPGPFQRAYASSVSFPFRVRGTQVRVVDGTVAGTTPPGTSALVYRLPAGQSRDALPIGTAGGQPFRTDSLGFLQGRGRIDPGDRLVALQPLPLPPTYTTFYSGTVRLYATSSVTDPFTVSQAGVQTLTVSASRPLLLFDLVVALEWDARKDTQYLSKLTYDLKRASELLYIWSRGQAALGNVAVYHDAPNTPPDVNGFQPWDDAHIRIFASNRLRPNSAQGGIVEQTLALTLTQTVGQESYAPGQVRMGAAWNRYGDSGADFAEDWARAFAHELGHFLLFLDDNYLGVSDDGLLVTVPEAECPGVMNNPYNDLVREFHPAAGWLPGCTQTLSHQETQRADWQTVAAFYPMLYPLEQPIPPAAPGPNGLPLAVTQISFQAPAAAPATLDVTQFALGDDGSAVLPGSSARAILYQGSRLIDLGRPAVDKVQAHGARPGDELCVYDLTQQRLGCEVVRAGDNQLELDLRPGWQPDISVTPVTSTTLQVFVAGVGALAPGEALKVRLFPVDALAGAPIDLAPVTGGYDGMLSLAEPAQGGYLRLWVADAGGAVAAPRRDAITDYSLGGSPVPKAIKPKPRPIVKRPKKAPVLSSDGAVTLYTDVDFAEGEFYALQATSVISPPQWVTVVGQGYRLIASAGAPPLTAASISFQYLGDAVPAGEENFLRIYFWDTPAQQWRPLDTRLDPAYNIASALAQGPGLYALMSSVEVSLASSGWSNFAYTVQTPQPPEQALASIAGKYTILWSYDRGTGGGTPPPVLAAGQSNRLYLPSLGKGEVWRVYSPGAPAWVNDLQEMSFGQGYWIYVTDPNGATLYLPGDQAVQLRGGSPNAAGANEAVDMPAVFYGVLPGAGPAGIQAWVDGNLCGAAETRDEAGETVFVIRVAAEDSGVHRGCGALGRTVRFTVDGEPAGEAAETMWDNRVAQEVSLQ